MMKYTFQVLNSNVDEYGYRPLPWNERIPDGVSCVCADCGDDCECAPAAYINTNDEKVHLAVCEFAAAQLGLLTACMDVNAYNRLTLEERT